MRARSDTDTKQTSMTDGANIPSLVQQYSDNPSIAKLRDAWQDLLDGISRGREGVDTARKAKPPAPRVFTITTNHQTIGDTGSLGEFDSCRNQTRSAPSRASIWRSRRMGVSASWSVPRSPRAIPGTSCGPRPGFRARRPTGASRTTTGKQPPSSHARSSTTGRGRSRWTSPSSI